MAESLPLRRRSLYRVRLLGSVRADEVLPAAELRRRLAWGRKSYTKAIADGLRVVRYGRVDYVLGGDVLEFFARLPDKTSTHDCGGPQGARPDPRPDVARIAGMGGASQ
jgi:hypothetical protein